jgi:hypothetical protein
MSLKGSKWSKDRKPAGTVGERQEWTRKGGFAVAKKMTQRERLERARKGAAARWK